MRTNLSDSLARVAVDPGERPHIVARNTFHYRRADGAEVTRLHHTDIIAKLPNGKVVLSSGGWKTMTTKDRLNTYLPDGLRVDSERGTWYVYGPDGARAPFVDGMVLPDAFKAGSREAKRAEKARRDTDKLKAEIKAFVAETIPAKGPLPMPSNGDCWYCLMTTEGKKTLGEVTGNTDHLREHVKERYMHGSLIVAALRDAGMQDTGIGVALHGYLDNLRVRRMVSRYLKKSFGMPLGAGS